MIVNIDLLNEIIDRVEYENLIEEGRDPVEVLHYKYQNVPADIIDAVIAIDPTQKKSYSQWLLSKWDSEKDTIVNNLKNGRIKKLFQHYKAHNDIQIKDCPSVEEGLRAFVPEEDTVLSKSSEPMTYIENLDKEVDSDLANDFDIVFDEDNWLIAVPHTYEAECKLGENMAWCTANHFGNGRSYYDNYLSRGGEYYVNFDMSRGESAKGKDYPYTRYQFHFESRQFMDKNDDPVQLDDIGIPQSAIEFYESEGYDTSDFEDEEAKMERYDQERWGCAYELGDGLCLNIAYNENYDFEEPDENTDFYIFDENDDRDPISWDEVPNPHLNEDVIVLKRDNYIALTMKGGDEDDREIILAIKETNSNGWRSYREWSAYRVSNWIELPDEMGIFGLDRSNYGIRKFAAFTSEGKSTYEKMVVKGCERAFLNEPCTEIDNGKWDRIFVETINDGYHSLFTIDTSNGELECVVVRDTPKNEEYYVIDENGAVEGLYGRYRAYDDGTDDGQEYAKYHLCGELENGDYIVGKYEEINTESNIVERKNILKRGEKEPLLDIWVDNFIDFKCNLYVAKLNEMYGFFNLNGEKIGIWYNRYGFLDEQQGLAVGRFKKDRYTTSAEDGFYFLNANEGVFAKFADVLTPKPVNNKVIVCLADGIGTVTGYDYVERKYCYQEFENIRRIKQYSDSFYCKLRNNLFSNGDEYVIFDFLKQQIVMEDIKNLTNLSSSLCLAKVEKTNGKFNIYCYDFNNSRVMFPTDVDKINKPYGRYLTYVLNNRYFIYNIESGQNIINPNGFDVEVYIDDSGYFVFSDRKYCLRFYIGENKTLFKGWNSYENSSLEWGYYVNGQDTPQDVVNLYNRVITQLNPQEQPAQQQQEPSYVGVTEEFKKIINRLNEARKLMHNNRFIE